jgi:hypothetical protein
MNIEAMAKVALPGGATAHIVGSGQQTFSTQFPAV